MRIATARLALVLTLLTSCESGPTTPPQPPPEPIVSASSLAAAQSAMASASAAVPDRAPATLSQQALMDHVKRLAEPSMKGRLTASDDERAAGHYIAEQLDRYGVRKLAGTREQPFAVGAGQSANIWGVIGGSDDKLKSSYVVIGAHYDHLGVQAGKIYPGAEDNASGVALVLEVTRALAAQASQLGRSLIVVFFGAEEQGLIGSKVFVQAPPVAIDTMHSMVNVDMIGRPLADQAALALPKMLVGIDGGHSVGVVGTNGRPVFRTIVDQACGASGIRAIAPEDMGRLQRMIERLSQGRGDSYRFEDVGVPALFFSSGESDDYHQPSDTVERINATVLAQRAPMIRDVVVALSHAPPDVTATAGTSPRTAAPTSPAAQASSSAPVPSAALPAPP